MKRIRISRFVLAGTAVAIGCGKADPPPVATIAMSTAAEPVKPVEAAPKMAVAAEPVPPIVDGGTFAFPDDTGGKLLAKTLPPAPPSARTTEPAKPIERRLPSYLVDPRPAPADAADAPPRLPIAIAKEIRPTPLPDRVPIALAPELPNLPERGDWPTGPLTRVAGLDVAKPADVPILSPRPVPDRAPLNDPTVDFTAASVISPMLPLRTEPAGFLRFNLPDPFENSAAARPKLDVPENPNRVLPTIPGMR